MSMNDDSGAQGERSAVTDRTQPTDFLAEVARREARERKARRKLLEDQSGKCAVCRRFLDASGKFGQTFFSAPPLRSPTGTGNVVSMLSRGIVCSGCFDRLTARYLHVTSREFCDFLKTAKPMGHFVLV